MSTLDTGWTNDHTPILVAVLVVLIAYILAQKIFKARGCPFAKASKTTGTATMGSCGNLQLTLAELAEYDGRDASKPLCISVRGTIYDVSSGRSFYGPGWLWMHVRAGHHDTCWWLSSRQLCCVQDFR